jgi:hypothetical protein
MKQAIITLLLSLIPLLVAAQSWNTVTTSDEYIWGTGSASTVAEADRYALADLVSRISTFVSSNTNMGFKEESDGKNIDHHSFVENRIKTYSQATLTNTERMILKNEPDATVGRYIKKAELNRIFESRKAKAIDMVESALRAETLGKADDALRYYYWALALIRSLQYPDEVSYTDDDGKKHILTTWIPEQMNHVFDDLKISVVRRKDDDVDLSIAYRGKPVSSVDYTYFDGRDWSTINSAKDGSGVLELAQGNQSSKYQLKFEYEYLTEAHIDKEVESVLNILSSQAMRKSYTTVDAEAVTGAAYSLTESFSQTDKSIIKAPTAATAVEVAQYAKTMDAAIGAIRSRQTDKVAPYFTKEGLDIFRRLIFSYGTARIIGNPQPIFYPGEGGEMTVRGIQASFSFRSGVRKSFVEDLVFTFNTAGKIDNVAFGLGKTAEDDILNKGVWSESARKVLMEFLENYKTAYALKRLDYINTIFDDDAIIIVANVAKRAQNELTDGKRYQDNKIIKYNRYSKDQYLKNLSRCFNANEYINIRFANNDVVKLGKGGETYGIQIAQDYYSSTYGDKGYLFLEVDVNNPKQPIIKVRTWQPEKDPNFGLYGPGDFK